MRPSRLLLFGLAIALLSPRPASATFHLMQIEQVLGGASGNSNTQLSNSQVQAIQLRTRSALQNSLGQGALIAYDASGLNPVILTAISGNPAASAANKHILFATPGFAALTTPSVTPDYTLVNRIPDSYLAAGSLTWESKADGTVIWRVSWGGANYTGATTGDISNDADGEFGPPFDGPLPSSSLQALHFNFAFGALSTNNANDYSVTAGAATFTNVAGASGTLNSLVGVGQQSGEVALALVAPVPNPVTNSMSYGVVIPRETRVELRIHDVSGRVVRSLVNRTLPAGRHNFSWNPPTPAALPNGIYFLELGAQGARQTRRFVLLR